MSKLHYPLLAAATCFASLTAVAQTLGSQFPKLSKTIDSLAAADRRLLPPMKGGLRAHSGNQQLLAARASITARHQPLLEALIKIYGYPGIRQVGEQSADNFSLLVQHADAYPRFQEQVLRLMWPEVQRKNARARHYNALSYSLAHRPSALALNAYFSRGQDLGYGKPLNEPLRPAKIVGKRRAAIGMETKDTYDYYMDYVNTLYRLEMTAPPEKQ